MESPYPAPTGTHEKRNSRTREILAAGTLHSRFGIPSSGQSSFTKQLIEELKRLNGKPCSIAKIYATIHQNSLMNGEIKKAPLHMAGYEKESIVIRRHTPYNL